MIELHDSQIDDVSGAWGRVWWGIGQLSRVISVAQAVDFVADASEGHPSGSYATAKIGTPLNY